MRAPMDRILTEIKSAAALVEAEIDRILSTRDEDYGVLYDAMRYSAQGGGKRIRPFLTLAFCKTLGGRTEAALPLAAAVELIHTYSLIHDDLPCMDNDDMRRGRPSNHKVFGEATALLAGDALLTLAFETVSKSTVLSAENRLKAVNVLAESAGARGMIGGQQLDLIGEKAALTRDTHLKMNMLKTGALIRAAARLGCIASDADADMLSAANGYAENVGLAFQVTDDLLDDGEEEQKTTFLTFMTRAEAEKYVSELTERAVGAVSKLQNNETLISLAYYLAKRKI